MKALIIELCGIPGAGKSTVAEALARALAEDGPPVHRPRARVDTDVPAPARLVRKTWLALGALARRPATARVATRIARAQPGTADGFARGLQWLITQRLLTARAGTVLLDEGLVQALWSAGLRAPLERVLAELERRHPRAPDLIVMLDIEPARAAERLIARRSAHSRVQARGGEVASDELVRGAHLLESILARVPAFAPRATLVRIDATMPAERAGDLIATRARALRSDR